MRDQEHSKRSEDDARFVKIAFRLPDPEDGFPPADVETMWARPLEDGTFAVENTPFFFSGIGFGDVVRTVEIDGIRWFTEIVKPSGHGTIRIVMQREEEQSRIVQIVRDLGFSIEVSHIPTYFAIDVCGDNIARLLTVLRTAHEAEDLDFDEGCKTW